MAKPPPCFARIVSEAKEIEQECRVAVVCHGKAATFWNYVYYLLGLPTAILAALAGVSAVNDNPGWAAAFAIAATIFAATNTFLNAGQLAKRAREKALGVRAAQERDSAVPQHHALDATPGNASWSVSFPGTAGPATF